MRHIIFSFLVSLAAIFFAGCPAIIDPPDTPAIAGPNVLVVRIAGEAAARTALPSVPGSASSYKIIVTHTTPGDLGIATFTSAGPFNVQLNDHPVAGDKVSVEAYAGTTKYAEETHILTSTDLSATPISVSIKLLLLTTGTGSVDLAISFAPGAGLDEITAAELSIYQGFQNYPDGVLYGFTRYRKTGYGEGTNFDPPAGGSISLTGNYPSGTYVAQIDFFRLNGVRVSRLAQTFVVRGNLKTEKWVESGSKTLSWSAFPSSNANLAGISIDGTPLVGYSPTKYDYSEYKPVGAIPPTTPIIVTRGDSGQAIDVSLNGAPGVSVTSGASTTLSALKATNSIVITVTAPDGVTKKTYSVGYTYYYNGGSWYVNAATGDDSAYLGNSPGQPFKTVEHALYTAGIAYDAIDSGTSLPLWPGKGSPNPIAARIHITGTFTGATAKVDVDGAVHPPILLTGDSGTINVSALGTGHRPSTISDGGTLILGDGVTLSGAAASGADGGVTVAGNSSFIMDGGTISGNHSGGVMVEDGSSFVMNGGTISGNEATGTHGGGVFVFGDNSAATVGTFIMNGGTISGNDAANGGGVYVDDKGVFIMNGGTISGNDATTNGGGVYLTSTNGATFTMTGGTIGGSDPADKNTAANGGGVYITGSSIFTMSGGTISKNNVSGAAGGVYVAVAAAGKFEMTGGSISGNTANNGGGGVRVTGSGSKFTLGGEGTVSGNYSAGGGGGVYVDNDGLLIMTGGSISGNTIADGKHGGGVLLTGGNLTKFNMSGGSITGNPSGTTGDNGTYGGGVYVGGGNAVGAGAVFTMSDGIISGNKSGWDGGGVYVGGGGSFVMDGGSISGNIGSSAGGVDVHQGNASFTMNDGIISGNIANNSGGGVGLYDGGNFTMNGGTISRNTARGGHNGYGGGGVNSQNASSIFNMTGGTISENTATGAYADGGGVSFQGTFTMSGGTIIGNTVTGANADGGGVCIDSSGKTFTMSGGTISGNSATGANSRGGGVYINNGSFTMSNTADIKENTAHTGGGGVYFAGGGSFTLNKGTINSNIVSNGNGGGININNGSFTINFGGSISISDNTAQGNGGGLYAAANVAIQDTGMPTMDQATIHNNTAGGNGGGLYTVAKVDINTSKVSISNNTAGGDGGGIYAYATGATTDGFYMHGGTVQGNKANGTNGSGGGVYINAGKFLMTAVFCFIGDNLANYDGGGVYVNSGAEFTMNNGTISGNTASNNGGGVNVYGAFIMTGGTISGNTASTGSGGGVYGSFTKSGGTVSDNSPDDEAP